MVVFNTFGFVWLQPSLKAVNEEGLDGWIGQRVKDGWWKQIFINICKISVNMIFSKTKSYYIQHFIVVDIHLPSKILLKHRSLFFKSKI